MFCDHPDQVEVCAKAGSLVLADARALHAAHRNGTRQRRDLLLLWHHRSDTIPDDWNGEIPGAILERDPDQEYPKSRIPGDFLR